eukprot:snap_masked-scaffold_12-processed-gene-10.46-mRNA-1 protein AED:0.01 eAED:0.01 QI:0/-1/0/1/-1/1/1/0/378
MKKVQRLILNEPDDFHHHFRDGELLKTIVPLVARQFRRAIAMPNLVPPVVTVDQALQYRERILKAVPKDLQPFEPLMTLYLTDTTLPDEITKAKQSGCVFACKLYPAGATTNSDNGVTNLWSENLANVFKRMEEEGILLLIHGEVQQDSHGELIDIFEREKVFVKNVLPDLVTKFPNLRIVLEHCTSKYAVEFVENCPEGINIAASITPQHLLFNRNEIFKGNKVRPHNFCLPVLKSEKHRKALLSIFSDTCKHPERFFLGTDSAAHSVESKLRHGGEHCGCAGVFSATNPIEFYLEALNVEDENVQKKFENFIGKNGATFYGLPKNTGKIILERVDNQVPNFVTFSNASQCRNPANQVVPLLAGKVLKWKFLSREKN